MVDGIASRAATQGAPADAAVNEAADDAAVSVVSGRSSANGSAHSASHLRMRQALMASQRDVLLHALAHLGAHSDGGPSVSPLEAEHVASPARSCQWQATLRSTRHEVQRARALGHLLVLELDRLEESNLAVTIARLRADAAELRAERAEAEADRAKSETERHNSLLELIARTAALPTPPGLDPPGAPRAATPDAPSGADGLASGGALSGATPVAFREMVAARHAQLAATGADRGALALEPLRALDQSRANALTACPPPPLRQCARNVLDTISRGPNPYEAVDRARTQRHFP